MTKFRERLVSSSNAHDSRVVLALDFLGPIEERFARAESILEELGDRIAAVKLNNHLILPRGVEGLEGVREACSRFALPLIADVKLNDIEATNLEAARILFENGFDAVIANPFVGLDEGLAGVLSLARDLDKGLLLLVYMSHRGAPEGYGLIVEGGKSVRRIFAERARDWGADGVIVSAKSPEVVREVRSIVPREMLVIAPGVGAQGGDASQAVEAGADFVIVGRSIVGADDPSQSLRSLNEQARGRR